MFNNSKYAYSFFTCKKTIQNTRLVLKAKPTYGARFSVFLLSEKQFIYKKKSINLVNQRVSTITHLSQHSDTKQATTVASANSHSLQKWLDSGFFNNSDTLDQMSTCFSASFASHAEENSSLAPNQKKASSVLVNQLRQKPGAAYSKNDEVKLVTIGLASPARIRQWAEKTLPNGKIVGEVTNANTLHHKTFKPQKGGLFCERIFGPLKDFQCACVNPKKKGTKNLIQNLALKSINAAGVPNSETPFSAFSQAEKSQNSSIVTDLNLQSSQGLGALQNYKRFFCPNCDVEYTWSVIRRYQLGYIQLNAPVTHVWYVKGSPSYISLLLGMKKKHVENVTYCTETLTLENSLKGDQLYNVSDSPREIFATWEKVTRAAGNSTLGFSNHDNSAFDGKQKRQIQPTKLVKTDSSKTDSTPPLTNESNKVKLKTEKSTSAFSLSEKLNTKNLKNWLKHKKNMPSAEAQCFSFFELNSNIHKNAYYIGNSSETTVNTLKLKLLASRKKESNLKKVIYTTSSAQDLIKENVLTLLSKKNTKASSTSTVSFVFNKLKKQKSFKSYNSLLTDFKQSITSKFINTKKSLNLRKNTQKYTLNFGPVYSIVDVPFGKNAQTLNQKNSYYFLKYLISLVKMKQKNMQKIYATSSTVNNNLEVDLTTNQFKPQPTIFNFVSFKFVSFLQKLKNKILHAYFDITQKKLAYKLQNSTGESKFLKNYLESQKITKKWSNILLIRTLVMQKRLRPAGSELRKQQMPTNTETRTLDSKSTLKYFIQALMINRVLIWIKKTPFQNLFFSLAQVCTTPKAVKPSQTTEFYLQNLKNFNFCLPTVILFSGHRKITLQKNFFFFVGIKQTNFKTHQHIQNHLSNFVFTKLEKKKNASRLIK